MAIGGQWRIYRGPSPPPLGRWTDAVTLGTRDVTTVVYYGDIITSLSLQTRKPWYSEYSK